MVARGSLYQLFAGVYFCAFKQRAFQKKFDLLDFACLAGCYGLIHFDLSKLSDRLHISLLIGKI
jgi:hypothetical protein